MFSIRSIKTVNLALLKHNNVRKQSMYHRGINFFFKKNLLLTNSITSGGFMVIGDLVEQEFEYQTKSLSSRYDWARAARMFTMGMILGPLHHYYYIKLDQLLPQVNYSTVFKKIIADQVVASPATLIPFFYGMGLLEKKTLGECTKELKSKFVHVYMGDCLFWPPVQFINFYFLPTHYRVVYINVATMVFNIFLSYMKHFDQHNQV